MLDTYKKNHLIILYNTFIAALLGVAIGAIDAVFGRLLLWFSAVRDESLLFFVPFLGIAGVIIIFLYKKMNEHSLSGMSLIFRTAFGEEERIPKPFVPLVILSTFITHLFGGSAGREGVAVQVGATVAHATGKRLNMPNHSRILLITGMAAGFAGLFQTPVAATLFAIEVLIAGVVQYEVLLPALTASFIASKTSHYLGLEKFSVHVVDRLSWSFDTIWKIVLVSILFGVVGGSFAFLLKTTKKYITSFIKNPYLRILSIGIILSVLLLIIQYGRYCGLGTNLISLSFMGGQIHWYDWIFKIFFTILTLSAGYQGGEVTPLFAIGASLGVVLGNILGLPIILLAALGYAAVFASATNTVLAPIFIGAEVFGSQNVIYFAIVCSIAYVFNANQSIYSGQKKFNYFSDLT